MDAERTVTIKLIEVLAKAVLTEDDKFLDESWERFKETLSTLFGGKWLAAITAGPAYVIMSGTLDASDAALRLSDTCFYSSIPALMDAVEMKKFDRKKWMSTVWQAKILKKNIDNEIPEL